MLSQQQGEAVVHDVVLGKKQSVSFQSEQDLTAVVRINLYQMTPKALG